MRTWVKWHTKVLTEPKVLRLSDKQFRVFANLIALAGYLDNEDGRLGSTEDVALHLRLSATRTGAVLTDLCAVGITFSHQNVWFLKNWDEYNGKPQSDRKEIVRERVRRFREKQDESGNGNADVTPLHPNGNASREEKNRGEEIREEEIKHNGAEVPAPATPAVTPPDEPEKPDPAGPLSVGQREFLQAFSAKRFKTNAQRDAVLSLEKNYGTAKLKECITWAAKRGMSLGEAVGAIETAIVKWGQSKANGHASKAGTKPNLKDPETVARLNAELNANRKKVTP